MSFSYRTYEFAPKEVIHISEDLISRARREHRFYDVAESTMLGLLSDLIPGSALASSFLEEWKRFEADEGGLNYGIYFLYPRTNHLVRFAPLYWHRLALLMRNTTLFLDPAMQYSWEEVRKCFDNVVVGIAGCSVGNSIAHALVGDLRLGHLKIADPDCYYLHNANRVRLSHEDLGRNKSVVTAEQIHALDPYCALSVFSEGVHEHNVKDFIKGNTARDEPESTVIVEETDSPDMKLFIREQARSHRKPVVMVTDLGSAVQRDVRRFDLIPDLPLTYGVSDQELYATRDAWRADLANKDRFFEFAFALAGTHHNRLPELKRIILKEQPPLFGCVPQLGSTAMMAGGVASEAVVRLVLGHALCERLFINKHTGEVVAEGEIFV
ncbi:MAG: ThiF family adenylyltransferase [Patescibacteria group bacterium]|nr:ThiF family adenylyltransferase [Patescibacteria group bacterium]MDE2438612.1 ThiF family adenylyltransferase [Patescibacteria group bacterium]